MSDFYRKVYLKSDEWKTRRAKKLALANARCALCKGVSFQNDIHHLTYRNIGDEKMSELKVLCRICHQAAHRVLELYPCIKNRKNTKLAWFELRKKIKVHRTGWSDVSIEIKDPNIKKEAKKRELMIMEATSSFRKARRRLISEGHISGNSEMKWDDSFLDWFEGNFFGVTYLDWFKFVKSGGILSRHEKASDE